MGHMDATELVREEDLDIWVSFGFILNGSMRSFMEIRNMIEEYLDDKKGQYLIHGTAAAVKLFIVKEKDYERLREFD